MILQPRARAGVALIAAYALAMQALLLAVIASSAGVAGAAALPICASAGAHPIPADDGQAGGGQAGHGQDCLDACLTGCCCGAPLQPLPPHALASPPQPLQALAAARDGSPPVPTRAAKAHRSRAPPVV
jgi:hypothetical protein